MDKCLLCEQIQPQNIENIYTEQQIQLVKDLTNMIIDSTDVICSGCWDDIEAACKLKSNLKSALKFKDNYEYDQDLEIEFEKISDDDEEEKMVASTSDVHMTDEKKRKIFDKVYDDINENEVAQITQWDYETDPKRQYIKFMNGANKVQIIVKITNTFNLTVQENGVEKTNKTLTKLSVDVITKLLNDLAREETDLSSSE